MTDGTSVSSTADRRLAAMRYGMSFFAAAYMILCGVGLAISFLKLRFSLSLAFFIAPAVAYAWLYFSPLIDPKYIAEKWPEHSPRESLLAKIADYGWNLLAGMLAIQFVNSWLSSAQIHKLDPLIDLRLLPLVMWQAVLSRYVADRKPLPIDHGQQPFHSDQWGRGRLPKGWQS